MITPQIESSELASLLGLQKLYFKREDLHPFGSHKGRSIPVMIDLKMKDGAKRFTISSSGNAALAAIKYVQKKNIEENAGLELTVFLGKNISLEKKQMLFDEVKDSRVKIIETDRPLQAQNKMAKEGASSLRQSNDATALIGYHSLGFEIGGTPDLSDVFIGSSTGTTAQAIADHMIKHEKPVAVHIVQTTENSTLIDEHGEIHKEKSIADAIVDLIGYRKDELAFAIQKTGGQGFIASNTDILKAQKLLEEKAHIKASGNGALGFAGLLKALDSGRKFSGAVVCIITGK
jgi:threonine synthase